MDFSEESDNICTPSPPRIKSLREESIDHCLQSPDKPTATKRTACKRTTKGPNKTKRGQTRPKPKNSSKQSRKRRPKEQLGPAYFSPPSTPSPPPSLLTHTATNHQHSPHNSNSGEPHSLPGKECDTTQETSSFLGSNTGHGKTACASSQLVAPSGHPDISDLFLDPQPPTEPQYSEPPQSPTESQYSEPPQSPTEPQYSEPPQSPTEPQCTSPTDHCSQSLRPAEHGSQSLTHGGELHRNGGVADMCSTNSGCLSIETSSDSSAELSVRLFAHNSLDLCYAHAPNITSHAYTRVHPALPSHRGLSYPLIHLHLVITTRKMATKGVPQMVKDVLPTVDNTKLGTKDHFTVLGEVDSVASRWKQFGGALNIPLSVLATIQTSHPTQPEDCLGDVLSQFLSMNYNNVETVGPPTWRLIVCALAHAAGGNNRELALEVAEDHKIESTTVSDGGASATGGGTSASSAAPDNRSILKEPPNQKDLIMITYNTGSEEKCYRPLEQISLHWRDIAGYLELSTAAINNAALKPTPTDSAREIMTSWTGSDTKASWSKLIKAMKVVSQLTVSAKELETALLNIVVDSD